MKLLEMASTFKRLLKIEASWMCALMGYSYVPLKGL